MNKALIEIKENDRVRVYDKRSNLGVEKIKGKVVKVKEGETLGREWTKILLNSGYKIVIK